MAEAKDTPAAPSSAAGTRSGAGFELRLERGGAYVRLADQPIAPGVRLESLTLQIPGVKFPFDVGQGAGQFRHRLADLVELSVTIDPSAAEAALGQAGLAAFGVEDLQLAPRDGYLEIAGRLCGGPPFTLEAGLLGAGDQGVALVFHSPRLLGTGPIPAATLPHLARTVLDAIGAEALPREPLAPLLRRVLAPRGWKLPRTSEVRLARAVVADGLARITWDRTASGPALTASDAELLAAEEGERTFREAEALLARGDHAAARDAYLAAGARGAAHPFAAERLLSLLALEERFHEEALDVAAGWLSRRPDFPAALAVEGKVRAARGESERAARAWASLAEGAAERGRTFLALAASEAAYALPGAAREDALRAAEVALRIRRDHVPALRAMRALARASGDREALLRANRRLVAHDVEPASKARAHAELGELLLEADPPGARLHLDQALRLAPDDADALATLGRACAAAGEPLRAIRALERLKELLLARGDRARAAAVAAEAGALWDGPLGHAENALLRHRESAELAPSADAHARAAAAAERAGQWAEAADHHAATLAALDPAAPGAAALAARTRVALADVAERRLGDAAAAAAHLERAAALVPGDADVLRRLVRLQRTLGRTAELIAALDRLAPLEPEGTERAALLAEAGEGALGLGRAADARGRFTAALAADGGCRQALRGLAQLARTQDDPVGERDALERLARALPEAAERAEVEDRLADACERTGDLSAAVAAAAAARASAPSVARLDASLRLTRRSGDGAALAALLAERAGAAAQGGDDALATDAWLERARLLAAGSPGEALAALAAARALSPGHAEVLRAQAELAEQTGDHRLALGCLRALAEVAPEDLPALDVRAARAALGAGDVGAAKDHAERALEGGAPGAAEVLDDILERAGDDATRAEVLARLGRHVEAARLFERHGDPARARAALERGAEDPAQAPQALTRLADLRLEEGDRPGAAGALLALARITEGREGARLALRAHAVGRDPAALDVAVDRDARFAPALARRAAHRVGTDAGAALADAEAALSGEALPDDERTALLALAVRAAATAGDGAAARRHLDAYCEANPDDDRALARLAALHRAAGARRDLARVLARRLPHAAGAEAAEVRLELSDLLAPVEPARAARLALDALEHDPASIAALRALTTRPRSAHVGPDERAALLSRLSAASAESPEDAAAVLAARAGLLAEAGDGAGALAAAREAARLAPEPDELLELRARLAAAQGDGEDAARALLARARRAREREEPAAAERLAEAGLAALSHGVEGAEEALRAALALGAARDTVRAVLEGLARIARERGDAAAEREALAPLVPLLPTGARPAALLRQAALALEAGAVGAARASAEEARVLAPRDLAALEACRSAALAAGDVAATAELLLAAARLDPAAAGPRLLERARLLAALDRAADADEAFLEALAALPPDRALAEEHARLRRDALPARSAAAPLEAFALREPDARASADALRAAAAVAVAEDDLGVALRCARGAFERSEDELAFAGPLLARLQYLQGGGAEALALHRRMLEAGFPGIAPQEAVSLCRQAADLAGDLGDDALALRALGELLRLRPQEIDAALLRFELDPDRERAARELATAAEACRSERRRALAFAHAAEAALLEASDRVLSERLFQRARDAAPSPALVADVALRRAQALRAAGEAASPGHLEALREAAETAQAACDPSAARGLLGEAIALERERGLLPEAAGDLLRLAALDAAEGDLAAAGARLRLAGTLQREAGDLAAATESLRRACTADPAAEEGPRLLEAVLRDRGPEGAELLLELLSDRAARMEGGPARAAALTALADALHAAGRGEEAIAEYEAALAAAPDDVAALVALARCVADTHGAAAARELDRHVVARAEVEPETVPAEAVARSRERLEATARSAEDVSPSPEPDAPVEVGAWSEPGFDPAPPPGADALAAARELFSRAGEAGGPEACAAAWVSSAEALARAGAPADEVRAAVDLACDADPDAVGPWRARARLETALGDAMASARAHLAVSIRAEGPEASRAALEASRLFDEAGQHDEAARAYRAAIHASPSSVPQEAVLAAEALAAGDSSAAADLLAGIDPAQLPAESRGAHARKLARALDAAGRADEAERAWTDLFASAPADAEAFSRASALALARGGVDAWIEAAATHEQALATWGESERQRDLRCERGRLLAEAGRTEGARGAYHAALEIDPGHLPTLDALVALDARRDDWAAAAGALANEAAQAGDGAEAAALYLRLAQIQAERLSDPAGAIAALRAAHARARSSRSPAARRTAVEAEALLRDLGAPTADDAPEAPEVEDEDGVAAVLAAHAAAAVGRARADLLEQLADHLERTGDRPGAARALLSALEADPEREGNASRLAALADGDAEVLARAALIRAGGAATATATPTPTPTTTRSVPAAKPRSLSGAPWGAPTETETEAAQRPAALARQGREEMARGEFAAAHERLSLAFDLEPGDLTIARDLCRVAEKLGQFGEYVQLGELCADAISAYDPLAASARFRHFAEVLRDRMGDLQGAAVMLEKALALVPGDPDAHRELVAIWAEVPSSAPRALEAWLEAARRTPSDAEALAMVATLCDRIAPRSSSAEAARLAERGRLALSIAAFASPSRPAAPPAPPATQLGSELRNRVAAPGATGPLARLLRLLAPWLEPLFQADLGRRGVAAEDRLDGARAPALHAALEAASRALGSRPFAAFLTTGAGREVALENSEPPAIVLSGGVAEMGAPELAFLAARTLHLLDVGWALVGKFAPKDVAILLELACRFAGAAPPSMGLPAERAGAFLAALETRVPARIRAAAGELAGSAAEELSDIDPRALAAALRRTSNRVALLYAGDPGAALRVLASLDRRLEGASSDPAQALALPDLRDLALFALSDPFVQLRAVLG